MPTHNEIEQALARWRAGEREIRRRHASPRWQEAYRLGVGAAVWHLQRYTTMVELIEAYFSLVSDPAERDWLRAICAESGLRLDPEPVRDAAYWQRAQQLVTQQHR